MRWKLNPSEVWINRIRVTLRSVFAVNLALLAIFSVAFTALFLWRLLQFSWKTWLGHPW